MDAPQFGARLTAADGKQLLCIRGPFMAEDGLAFEVRMVAVEDMGKLPTMWKEEVDGDKESLR